MSDQPDPDPDPALRIDILRACDSWPAWAEPLVEKAAQATYLAEYQRLEAGAGEGLDLLPDAATVSVLLADDEAVQTLNRDFRHKDKPTNVLSFPNDDPPLPGEDMLLGDMVMAWQTVVREAEDMQKKCEDHATHLVVHAMLHLMGYDHEEESEAQEMESFEINILQSRFGIANPYEEETA